MNISVFDVFRIGIGPSSSHTVGPMLAVSRFLAELESAGLHRGVGSVRVHLYGSLALTGVGHGTDNAVLIGLLGEVPDKVDPAGVADQVAAIRATARLRLGGWHEIDFDPDTDLLFHKKESLPEHPNGMVLEAFDREHNACHRNSYFSIGGGAVLSKAEIDRREAESLAALGKCEKCGGDETRCGDAADCGLPSVRSRTAVARECRVTVAEQELALAGDIDDRLASPERIAPKPTPAPRPVAAPVAAEPRLPYPFASGAELIAIGKRTGLSIASIVRANELARTDAATLDARLMEIWRVMHCAIERGLVTEGILPGGLNVKRRAPALYRRAVATGDDFSQMDTVSAFAIAVNEENACGGRVVTAPTNGSAGVIPAVLAYYRRSQRGADDAAVIRFLLTAAGIGMLYKKNASISAAEMGCQGEIGVSSSMAAAGLAAVLGGTNEQVENAAEIAMEHHLGMTCDPIGGLVQVPCIERNSMGAIKAINAARLALQGDGSHLVSLDACIETMRQTGIDLQSKYKETALGGLAITVVEC
ncbi:L-serine ammonia-lyase [Derxia lacustris]|uniref:L-serine ammonia-lyase n=1 Tax=Derxia lacustris TaxID=764842 RepID=UPI000A177880|nr:L-serine ammonia-lyase [Derxia lacustris]